METVTVVRTINTIVPGSIQNRVRVNTLPSIGLSENYEAQPTRNDAIRTIEDNSLSNCYNMLLKKFNKSAEVIKYALESTFCFLVFSRNTPTRRYNKAILKTVSY
ncbi:hypothetical protein A0H76_2347 [Hepatospora eriocheir]|uniref:Uncharacterized protein n=1 Tax=Hepatospora eriocheir TaxID=1081669 RepID=A0A1X0QFG5_9MICR|nr:hypothetical protein A0H76_2347 [Hepatospora eriocheir]